MNAIILKKLSNVTLTLLAICNAVKSFNPESLSRFDVAFTPEKVLMNLYNEDLNHKTIKANTLEI